MPAPEGPCTAMLSPRPAVNETPRRILTGPALLVRVRYTSSSSTAGPLMSSRRSPGRVIAWIGIALGAWLLLFAPPGAAGEPAIVVLGDSLAAGFGLPGADAFPARLEAALRAEGHGWRVIDAGVSGDTSAGGRARLDWVLADKPDIVIVELGANDGLRGLPVAPLEANLDAILAHIGETGAAVLLAGMRAPANFGAGYEAAFRAVYERLAERA